MEVVCVARDSGRGSIPVAILDDIVETCPRARPRSSTRPIWRPESRAIQNLAQHRPPPASRLRQRALIKMQTKE